MNRDFFTRPHQGNGRDHHDYGHAGFSYRPRASWRSGWFWVGFVIAVVMTSAAVAGGVQ